MGAKLPDGSSILFKGTSDYEVKVKAFKLSPEQALQKSIDYQMNIDSTVAPFGGVSRVIVGDWYVFSAPDKSGYVSLCGYYVNGFTGEVCERHDMMPKKVKYQ